MAQKLRYAYIVGRGLLTPNRSVPCQPRRIATQMKIVQRRDGRSSGFSVFRAKSLRGMEGGRRGDQRGHLRHLDFGCRQKRDYKRGDNMSFAHKVIMDYGGRSRHWPRILSTVAALGASSFKQSSLDIRPCGTLPGLNKERPRPGWSLARKGCQRTGAQS